MRIIHYALAAAASVGLGVAAAAPAASMGIQYEIAPQVTSTRARQRQALGWIGALPPKYRNRWKAQRRAKRKNMLHVSRRTRRKHRRARAA